MKVSDFNSSSLYKYNYDWYVNKLSGLGGKLRIPFNVSIKTPIVIMLFEIIYRYFPIIQSIQIS